MPNTNTLSAFDTAYNGMAEGKESTIAFNKLWMGSSAYFENGVNDIKLEAGERRRSIDMHGRRMILIGTRVGTVIIFERHKEPTGVVVGSYPRIVASLFGFDGALSHQQIDFITGGRNGYMNIGHRIDEAFQLVKFHANDQAVVDGEHQAPSLRLVHTSC